MTSQYGGTVSIIIVNWNTRDLLINCIESIIRNVSGVDYEVIVVDNASHDGSAAAVTERFPICQVIKNDQNLGFAVANNIGIRVATGDLILLLNPDTIMPQGTVEALCDFLSEHPEVGAVGPKLLGNDNQPQVSSFGMFPSPTEAAIRALRIWRIAPWSKAARRFIITPEDGQTWVYTRHLLGACMLLRREVIEQVGGFDEEFFLFLEETDLCYRVERVGWRLAYFTGSCVKHLGEQSMQNILHRTGGLYIRSYNRFCRKHGIRLLRRASINLFLAAGILTEAGIALLKYRSLKRAGNSLRALWYGYVVKP